MEDVMDAPMDIGTSSHQHPQGLHQASNTQYTGLNTNAGTSWPASHARICLHISTVPVLTEMDRLYRQMRAVVAGVPPAREQFKEIAVKVHIRRPERDTWAYMGRGIVTQELTGQSSRVGTHAFILCASIRASDMPYIFSRQGPIISQDSDRVRRGASSFSQSCAGLTASSRPGLSPPGGEAWQLRRHRLCRRRSSRLMVSQCERPSFSAEVLQN